MESKSKEACFSVLYNTHSCGLVESLQQAHEGSDSCLHLILSGAHR